MDCSGHRDRNKCKTLQVDRITEYNQENVPVPVPVPELETVSWTHPHLIFSGLPQSVTNILPTYYNNGYKSYGHSIYCIIFVYHTFIVQTALS